MHARYAVLLLISWACLSDGAVPTFHVTRSGSLYFAASDLTTNGVPGLSNSALQSIVSFVPNRSEQGGKITLVNTQAWVRICADARFAAGIAVGLDGRLSIAGGRQPAGNGFVTVSYAANGTALWTNRHDLPGTDEIIRYVAMDDANNTFVAGESGTSPERNIVTIKYDPTGVALWTNVYNETGTNSHQSVGLVADSSGNVIVAFNTFHDGRGRFSTVKYDAAGTALWTNRHRATDFSSDWMSASAVDRFGNSVVTGSDFLTFKYSPEGLPLWTNRLSGNAASLALDREGNTVVCGDTFVGGHRYGTVKWGPLGTPLWTNYMAAPQYQGGYVPQVFVDGDEDILILGGTANSTVEDIDLTVTKLSRNGLLIWTNRFFEAGGGITPRGVAVDAAGNLSFVIPSSLDGGNDFDFLTIKFRGDGTLFSSNRFSAGTLDHPHSLAINKAGHVLVSGETGAGLTTVKYVEYVRYTPPPNFVGTDTFTFVAVNDTGARATNTVFVEVSTDIPWFNPLRSNLRGASNGFHLLHLDGAGTNRTIILYASPNLSSWTPIATNLSMNGEVEFLTTPTGDRRFYRAIQAAP